MNRRTLRLFVKGNRDVMDALLLLQTGSAGVKDVSDPVDWAHRNRFDFQIFHETGARADLILQSLGEVPAEIYKQGFSRDCDWIVAQFGSRLFDEQIDAVVLAMQPSVVDELWRQREQNYLFCPESGWKDNWSPAQRQWLKDSFLPMGLMQAGEFECGLRLLVQAIREHSNAPVLVFNCSSVDPSDTTFRYGGVVGESWSVRAQKFNLALVRVSAEEGVSIIDVDRIVGELGAGRHVEEFGRYSEDASRAICRECVRVMEDIGVFQNDGPVTEDRLQKDGVIGLRLTMPFVNRLSHRGIIVRWHKKVGDRVRFGDDLLDIDMQIGGVPAMSRGERIRHLVKPQASPPDNSRAGEKGDELGAVISVRVTSADSGYLRWVEAPEGSERNVGDLLALMTVEAGEPLVDGEGTVEKSGTFKVAVNIAS